MKCYVFFYMVLVGFVMLLVIIKKGLKYVGLEIGLLNDFLLVIVIVIVLGFFGKWFIGRMIFSGFEDKDL